MMNNELTHWGVKGQKWGVRKYQNKDGSLTPAGKQRYGTKENFESQYHEDVKSNIKTTKKMVDAGKDVAQQNQRISNEKRNNREKQAKVDKEQEIRDRVYKMSDQELRDAVNRLNMEERYTQVMRDREVVAIGKTRAEKFMDYSATALTIGSTALSIALMIKELKK